MQKLNNSRTNCNSQDGRDKEKRKNCVKDSETRLNITGIKKYGQGMARDSGEWRKIVL